ncbi:plastoglobule-localized metallopeptidase 48, chloroplastic-like [Arachis hypogaea]|uniref:plastoglobule-localized metallopeptidase 48, chloroplastic-like n=1 Tax=Arachis hypogaea TaxID=3818 RepID=UPI003B20E198
MMMKLRTAIPGLNELGKALLGSVAEQVMLLENIGTSVLVSKNQLPDLHHLMVEAAQILNVDSPDLYVRQSPVPNAYTLAISGKRPFVVIHTSLLELLTRAELQELKRTFSRTGHKRNNLEKGETDLTSKYLLNYTSHELSRQT